MQPTTQHQPSPAPVPPSPLRTWLAGADHLPDAGSYLVVPIPMAVRMPPGWQEQAVRLMEELHTAWSGQWLPRGRYRVEATQPRPLIECTPPQLSLLGITADYDEAGTLVYRHGDGAVINDPATHTVLVPVLDPVLGVHRSLDHGGGSS